MESTSGIIDREKYKYPRIKVRGMDDKIRHSAGSGDAVFRALAGLTHDDLWVVLDDNGLGEVYRSKEAATGHGARGRFRMNVGNSLRAKVKRGEKVRVGSHVIKALDQLIKNKAILD